MAKTLLEMMAHPWAALRKVAGLDVVPDRRMTKHANRNYTRSPNPTDPIAYHGRVQSIYRAIGVDPQNYTGETRIELYENFREMDVDPMIAGVLDNLAGDASQVDPEHNRVVWAESSSDDVTKIVTRSLDRLRIDEKAFPVQRSIGRDGEVLMRVCIARGKGVVALRPYEPWMVARIEDDLGRLTGFSASNERGDPALKDKTAVPPHEVLHFRLPARRLTTSYGVESSFLWGSRTRWRELQLMEDQIVIQRLLRRPDKILVLMDTGGMTYDDAWATITEWERRLHREQFLDPAVGRFDSRGAPIDMAKDIILPRGPMNKTQVTNFPATNTNDLLRDYDLIMKMLACSIGFPLGYLGYEDGNYTPNRSMSYQHQPSAIRATRLQHAFLVEVTRACMIDMALQGMDPMLPQNAFSLHMTSVSPIMEMERSEVIQLKMDRMERALAFGDKYNLNSDVWVPYVLKKYGGLTDDLIRQVYVSDARRTRAKTQSLTPAHAIHPDAQPGAFQESLLSESGTKIGVDELIAKYSGQISKIIPEAKRSMEVASTKVELIMPAGTTKINESLNPTTEGGSAIATDAKVQGIEESMIERRREGTKTRVQLMRKLIGSIDLSGAE